jgi:uncharacterized membrane protein YhaH (DUF805 family)
MDLWKFVFRFKGRIKRTDFWLLILCIAALLAAAAMATSIYRATASPLAYVSLAISLVSLIAAFTIFLGAVVRRLHDRNRSGWFIFLCFGLQSGLESYEKESLFFSPFYGSFDSAIEIISMAVSLAVIVDLGCLRGTLGANRYGDDPIETAPTQLTPNEQ